MSFHPRMYAKVKGVSFDGSLQTVSFEDMAVDLWCVHVPAGAVGDYVSPHPRIVIFLDGASLRLFPDKKSAGRVVRAFYIPAGQRFWSEIEPNNKLRHLDIHIHRKTISGLNRHGLPTDAPVLLPDCSALIPLTEPICTSLADHESVPRHLVETLVTTLFQIGHDPDDWRHIIKAHIIAYLDTTISIDTLAGLAGLSRTQFNRRFRSDFGQSAYQHILKTRIALAQDLIRAGTDFVEIAAQTGFADQAHFTRCFKRITQQTPSAWARSDCSRQNS